MSIHRLKHKKLLGLRGLHRSGDYYQSLNSESIAPIMALGERMLFIRNIGFILFIEEMPYI